MMKSNYREIWATPIAEYYLDDITIHNELVNIINNTSWGGDDSMNLFKEPCRFSEWVLDCVKDYTSKFNYPLKSASIQRGWCVLQHPFYDTFIHTHYTADIAAVYYVDVIPEHPPLEVIDPRPAHNFNMVHRKLCDGVNVGSGFSSIQIPVATHKLILHPGYLHHGVSYNLTDKTRTVVAMNVMAKRDLSVKRFTC